MPDAGVRRHPRRGGERWQMASPRRVGTATSKTRTLLLNSAEQLMLREGYAAVTYRSLAARAGVTAGLVQYYFPTLDDLFVAVVRRRTEQALERLAEAFRSDQPLRAVWEYASDKAAAALTAEFMALANHRKKIRAEIAESGEQVRRLALRALSGRSERPGFLREPVSYEVLVFLMTSIPRMIVMEEAVGMSTAHAEMVDFVERYLDRVEPRPAGGNLPGKPAEPTGPTAGAEPETAAGAAK